MISVGINVRYVPIETFGTAELSIRAFQHFDVISGWLGPALRGSASPHEFTSIITKRVLEQDLASKARHMMKRASVGLDGR